MVRKIASNLLHYRGKFLRNPIVEVDDESGEILSVDFDSGNIDRCAGVEFYSGVMCAGFVNMHAHLELSYLKGEIAEGCGFTGFAAQIGAIRSEERFTPEFRANAIERADLEMQREGIKAVADIVNGSTTFALKSKSNTEYHSFAEVFGLKSNNLERSKELLKCAKIDGLKISLTQHSAYSLNDKIFKDIAHCNDNVDSYPLSIHFLESAAETELFAKRGPLYDWYAECGFEVDFLEYGSPAKRIVASIPRDKGVILVHNCFITKEDIELLAEHFSAPVNLVLCPESNRYISGILPPVDLLTNNSELNICIGTDSLASTTSLSILEQIRLLQSQNNQNSQNRDLGAMLDWATANGAKALNLNHLGAIEAGKRPGINIISGIDYETMQLTKNSRITVIIH